MSVKIGLTYSPGIVHHSYLLMIKHGNKAFRLTLYEHTEQDIDTWTIGTYNR